MTEQVKFAYDLFARSDIKSFADARVFKKAFCRQVPITIEFIGVWDTVASVGRNKTFPFTANNLLVKTVRHAIALDEHRAKFKPNWWGRDTWDARKPELESGHNPKTDVQQVWFAGAHCDVGGGSVLNGTRHALSRIPLRWMIRECFATNTGILFKAVKLRTAGLEPATLYPKVLERNEAFATTGMLIKAPMNPARVRQEHHQAWETFETIQRSGSTEALLSLQTQGPLPYGQIPIPEGMATWDVPHYMLCHNLNKPVDDLTTGFVNENEEELGDCLEPHYDQLKLKWYWKWLEYVPFRSVSWVNGLSSSAVKVHSAAGRLVIDGFPGLVHRSVRMRMESDGFAQFPGGKYTPKAGPWPPKNIQWVD